MGKITTSNLEAAFAGESQAHIKYLIFADKAEKEGFSNIARLFRAIAYAEQVHATAHFKVMKKVGKTVENLQAALDGENFEISEMYPAFLAVAEQQGEKAAIRAMTWALESEKGHATMYADAKQAVESGADSDVGAVHVCELCGWTTTDDLPDTCPVCNAKAKFFRSF